MLSCQDSCGAIIRVMICVIEKDYDSCSGTSSWCFVSSIRITIRIINCVILLQSVPNKMRLEIVNGIPNEILDGHHTFLFIRLI